MPTRRGWLLMVGAAALITAGRLLGTVELYALGAASIAAFGFALAYVRGSRFHLAASRDLRPGKVNCGGSSRVELAIANLGRRRSPVLFVRDPFDGGRRWARFLVAPLDPGETARAAYRLPTDRRGVYPLGPLQLVLRDPLALASRKASAAGSSLLTVYPRIDRVEPLPDTLGHDPYAGAEHPTTVTHGGEDFYALRPYEMGDDLRRVHWPSTARLGDLMIRQDELPWQGRATVAVDLRHQVHNGESLEMVLSAAASIIDAGWRRRSLLRLATTSGGESEFGSGAAHVEALLERLAAAQAEPGASLAALVASLRREGNGGALAIITTAEASDADLQAAARLRGRFGHVSLVLFDRSAYDRNGDGGLRDRRVPPGPTVVRVTGTVPFAAAWDQSIHRRRLARR